MSASPLILDGLLGCRRCPIYKERFRVVPGFGNHAAKLMIVGQSPGIDEDQSGKPMVGRSGEYLTQQLRSMGVSLDDYCFRTNVNHCHPHNNREATPAEVRACVPFLAQEVEIVDPVVILAMGGAALKVLLPGESTSITQVRGHVYERQLWGRKRFVIPCLHPAAVLRNRPAYEKDFRKDLRTALEIAKTGTYKRAALPFRKHRATLSELLAAASRPEWGFDLETDTGNGADDDGNEIYENDQGMRGARVIGVGVCDEPGNGLYYPFATDEEAESVMSLLAPYLENESIHKIVSNAKFERHICNGYGITLRNWDDTMLMAWVAGDYPLGLKDGFHRATGIEMIRIDTFKKRGYKRKDPVTGQYVVDMRAAQDDDPVAVAEYAAQDPDASLRLYAVLRPLLEERNLWRLYREVEVPFNDVIIDVETNGIHFDPAALEEAAINLEAGLHEVNARIATVLGYEMNPGSWQQVQKALYEAPTPYRLPEFKVTRSQKNPRPTDKVSLAPFSSNLLVRDILTAKAITKMQGTYIKALPKWMDANGRIHAEYKQASVATGRLSSARPNATNIPARKRDDTSVDIDGSLIRKGFTAP